MEEEQRRDLTMCQDISPSFYCCCCLYQDEFGHGLGDEENLYLLTQASQVESVTMFAARQGERRL